VEGPGSTTKVDKISLVKGESVILVDHDPSSEEEFHGWKTETETRIKVNYEGLSSQVEVGMKVLVADGNIELEVTKV
jgi:pyruvate kinase